MSQILEHLKEYYLLNYHFYDTVEEKPAILVGIPSDAIETPTIDPMAEVNSIVVHGSMPL
jgi:hypothetical protein